MGDAIGRVPNQEFRFEVMDRTPIRQKPRAYPSRRCIYWRRGGGGLLGKHGGHRGQAGAVQSPHWHLEVHLPHSSPVDIADTSLICHFDGGYKKSVGAGGFLLWGPDGHCTPQTKASVLSKCGAWTPSSECRHLEMERITVFSQVRVLPNLLTPPLLDHQGRLLGAPSLLNEGNQLRQPMDILYVRYPLG